MRWVLGCNVGFFNSVPNTPRMPINATAQLRFLQVWAEPTLLLMEGTNPIFPYSFRATLLMRMANRRQSFIRYRLRQIHLANSNNHNTNKGTFSPQIHLPLKKHNTTITVSQVIRVDQAQNLMTHPHIPPNTFIKIVRTFRHVVKIIEIFWAKIFGVSTKRVHWNWPFPLYGIPESATLFPKRPSKGQLKTWQMGLETDARLIGLLISIIIYTLIIGISSHVGESTPNQQMTQFPPTFHPKQI
jgi:hypothetical protein